MSNLLNFIELKKVIGEKGIVSKKFVSVIEDTQSFEVDKKGLIQNLNLVDFTTPQFLNDFGDDDLEKLKEEIKHIEDKIVKYKDCNLSSIMYALEYENDLLEKELKYEGDFSLLSKEDRIKYRGYRYGKKVMDLVYDKYLINMISNSLYIEFKNKDKLAQKIYSDLSNHSPSGYYEIFQLLDTQVDLVNETVKHLI